MSQIKIFFSVEQICSFKYLKSKIIQTCNKWMLLSSPTLLSNCQNCKGMNSTGQAKSNQAKSYFLPLCCLTKYLQNIVQLHVVQIVQLLFPCRLPFAFSPHFYESTVKWSVGCFCFSVLSELSGPTHLKGHCSCLWKAPYCAVISSALPPDSEEDIFCALKSLIPINRALS